MNNLSAFVRHEPCPNCGSRDNLGLWSDGHKFCFGCQYYFSSQETLADLTRKTTTEAPDDPSNNGLIDCVFDPVLPLVALKWLAKYGITEHEISHYKLAWNKDTESLVFPIYGMDGELKYRQERYFGTSKRTPKYITYGSKRHGGVGILQSKYFPDTVVLVEDFISAIKVCRVCSAVPLLGSNVPASALFRLSRRFQRAGVWLDLDKASNALREASKARIAFVSVSTIVTTLDPKEYSTQRVYQILSEVFGWGGKVTT